MIKKTQTIKQQLKELNKKYEEAKKRVTIIQNNSIKITWK